MYHSGKHLRYGRPRQASRPTLYRTAADHDTVGILGAEGRVSLDLHDIGGILCLDGVGVVLVNGANCRHIDCWSQV
jgi:hypothetical protein